MKIAFGSDTGGIGMHVASRNLRLFIYAKRHRHGEDAHQHGEDVGGERRLYPGRRAGEAQRIPPIEQIRYDCGMPRYIRAFVPGGTFFFTVALLDRRRRLLTNHIDLLRDAFSAARARRPFALDAIVILPDHLHCIWTLPPGDADFSSRWHAIKAAFSRSIPRGERLSPRRSIKGERGIWQRRFWEHTIRNERDFERHADYIHFNPVKHGHARRPADWPFSSFRRYVERGIYPLDWGGSR